jgi:hypothetical protein
MASILLENGNKYTDEREKQFYLNGYIKICVHDMSIQ